MENTDKPMICGYCQKLHPQGAKDCPCSFGMLSPNIVDFDKSIFFKMNKVNTAQSIKDTENSINRTKEELTMLRNKLESLNLIESHHKQNG